MKLNFSTEKKNTFTGHLILMVSNKLRANLINNKFQGQCLQRELYPRFKPYLFTGLLDVSGIKTCTLTVCFLLIINIVFETDYPWFFLFPTVALSRISSRIYELKIIIINNWRDISFLIACVLIFAMVLVEF